MEPPSRAELPNEIWMQILSQVTSRQDLWNMRTISKTFSKLILSQLDIILKNKHKIPQPALFLKMDQGCQIASRTPVVKLTPTKITDTTVEFELIHEKTGFKGLSKMIEEMCRYLVPYTSDQLQPQHSVTDSPSSQHDPETPDGDALPALPLKNKCPFQKQEYERLVKFLKEGWEGFTQSVPPTLRGAYGLCERDQKYMDANLQLALICQTWRVVDVLAPPSTRDTRVCNEQGCCGAVMDLEIACSWPWDTIADQIAVTDPEMCKVDTLWEWNHEKGNLKLIRSILNVSGIKTTIHFLAHGEHAEHLSVVDIKATMKKQKLMRSDF